MAEQATPVTPSHRGYTAAVIGLLLLAQACGLWLLFNSKLDAAQLQPAAWFDGEAGKALGDALQPELQKDADTLSAAVRYRLLGDLGDQVVQGCPGWLFYRDGLRAQAGVSGAYEARLRLMQHWVGQLRSQGLQVLLVAVPDKSRIEARPSAACSGRRNCRRAWASGKPAWPARACPMPTSVRPWPTPRKPTAVFPHRCAPQCRRRPARRRCRGRQRPAAARWQARPGVHQLPGGRCATAHGRPDRAGRPGARRQRLAPDHGRRTPAADPGAAGGGLLDDTPPVQVLLAGSSNGRRSAFAERLGRNLGQQVWNQSLDGGQFSGALLAALGKRERWPASLKLVIWEFSESALSLPLTADERAVLATLPEPQADHAL
jgi:alginate O-acetyltransferase complex protein AlgJ